MKGVVIKSTGSWYGVTCEDQQTYACRIRGKFRLMGINLTNPVAVGDEVEIILEEGQSRQGLITTILPRRNYVVRQSPRKKHQLHLLASNVDQAMLVATVVNPKLKQGFIDRFLLMTEPHDIPAIIVFNKSDLYNEDALEIYAALEDMYTEIGYKVMLCSSLTGQGMDEVKSVFTDKTTLVSGQSGVGKSSLINAVEPGLGLKTTELSDYSGKGQHTTTFAEMFFLKTGGRLIDTPGIKTLSYNNLEVMDVTHNFREFFEYSKECKFTNCTHINEPGCAVKSAIEDGYIHELRYLNYLQIIEEIEDQNYWERHKDL